MLDSVTFKQLHDGSLHLKISTKVAAENAHDSSVCRFPEVHSSVVLEFAPGPFHLLPIRMLLLRTKTTALSPKGDNRDKVILSPDRNHGRDFAVCTLSSDRAHSQEQKEPSFFY